MNLTFKALSALLGYPSAELRRALPEIAAVLESDRNLPRRERRSLRVLADTLATNDLIDAQEAYVAQFDRGRSTSLHLFEHVHGDSRDRGQAMVDLREVYARAGFVLSANELPDYLPALLEFLSLRPDEVAREMLGDCAHILRNVGAALKRRDSVYAAVFAALLALIGEDGLEAAPGERASDAERTLDEEWLDAPVVFGQAAGAERSVIRFMPRPGAARD